MQLQAVLGFSPGMPLAPDFLLRLSEDFLVRRLPSLRRDSKDISVLFLFAIDVNSKEKSKVSGKELRFPHTKNTFSALQRMTRALTELG